MKIVKIQARNFMGLRNINLAVNPKGLIQVTGRNGQGKSTLLKLIEWLFEGPTSIQRKLKKSVIRNGTDKAWAELELSDEKLGDFLVTRTMTENGFQDVKVFDQNNNEVRNQQKGWLDEMFNQLSFDPLGFSQMDTEEQIHELKRLGHVDLDFDAMANADIDDTKERKDLKKDAAYLENQLKDMSATVVLDGLSMEKINETAIFNRLNEASTENRRIQALNQARDKMREHVAGLERERSRKVDETQKIREDIEAMKRKLKQAEKEIIDVAKNIEVAQAEFESTPEIPMVDVAALTAELKDAQTHNRAVDTRADYDRLMEQFNFRKARIFELSTRLEDRDKMRAEAIANAALPVDGLSFDEHQVYFQGPNGKLPLASLGEGEQIRISTLLGIAMHPTLCCMCIQHGEALDEDGLRIIEQLAVEHDFQILMARVETSGEVGIVIEDGQVKTDNYRASYTPTKARLAQQRPGARR